MMNQNDEEKKDSQSLKQMITLCGDNCLECPRYLAKSKEELEATARLWHQVGWRDSVVSADEIKCGGCSSHKECTYHLVECIKEKGIAKCNQCSEFPCNKINDMIERSKKYEQKCREVCNKKDFEMLSKAFFYKEENLKK